MSVLIICCAVPMSKHHTPRNEMGLLQNAGTKPLASLFEGGGSPQGLTEGVLLDPRTLPQSKIKDFCQPPH